MILDYIKKCRAAGLITKSIYKYNLENAFPNYPVKSVLVANIIADYDTMNNSSFSKSKGFYHKHSNKESFACSALSFGVKCHHAHNVNKYYLAILLNNIFQEHQYKLDDNSYREAYTVLKEVESEADSLCGVIFKYAGI